MPIHDQFQIVDEGTGFSIAYAGEDPVVYEKKAVKRRKFTTIPEWGDAIEFTICLPGQPAFQKVMWLNNMKINGVNTGSDKAVIYTKLATEVFY